MGGGYDLRSNPLFSSLFGSRRGIYPVGSDSERKTPSSDLKLVFGTIERLCPDFIHQPATNLSDLPFALDQDSSLLLLQHYSHRQRKRLLVACDNLPQ